MPTPPDPLLYRGLVKRALEEDLGHGDATTNALIPEGLWGEGLLRAKEELILCGLEVARLVFALLDQRVSFESLRTDGELLKPGETAARLKGPVASILKGERVALNFVQHLSGVATYTRRFVEKVSGLPVRIVDTRKTLPGFRVLEKYAVAVGGGYNHRFGLSDGVLIKDNHIKACGSVAEALKRARERLPHVYRLEIEVKDSEELDEALKAGADAILLDNMDIPTLRKAVKLARRQRPEIILEASGGVNLENVRPIAETGVDLISIGKLTHSAPAVDLHLKIVSLLEHRQSFD